MIQQTTAKALSWHEVIPGRESNLILKGCRMQLLWTAQQNKLHCLGSAVLMLTPLLGQVLLQM